MLSKYGKVAVLMGGESNERDISLLSGEAVLQSLIKSNVDAHAFDPSSRSLYELKQENFARALIMLHGKGGEDGVIQGVLEYLKIPYSGSGVSASSLAMDKYRTKLIWRNLGISLVPDQYLVKQGFNYNDFQLQLNLPIVVKPVYGGSTIGVSKVYAKNQLKEAIELAFTHDDYILLEEMIIGDELAVTIEDRNVYPLVKIEAPQDNYDYIHKYFSDETVYIYPYELAPHIQKRLISKAVVGYNAIGTRGVARIDIILDKNEELYFLEINTIPGMTAHSLVPMAFNAAGIGFDALCLRILDGAKLGG